MTDKLLIFDCDGTLVDSEQIANEVFVTEIQKLGIALTHEEAWQHFPGTSLSLCMAYVEETYDVSLPEDFIGRYRQVQRLAFAEGLQPVQGVRAALNKLGATKCVASNGPMDIIRSNLMTTKLDHFFGDRIFSAYDLNKWKPLPDLFLHAADVMQVPPSDCIVIEDSTAGIEAGMNAGMTVLAFQPDHQQYRTDFDETLTFTNMSELPGLVDSLIMC